MPGSFQLLVYDRQQKVYQDTFSGPVELGRQRDGKEVLYSCRRDGERARLVVARLDEDTVSREHACIEPLAADRIRVTNKSAKVSIRLSDGGELRAGTSCELEMPANIALGRKTVRVQPVPESGMTSLRGLNQAPAPPGSIVMSGPFKTMAIKDIIGASAAQPSQIEEIVRWLQMMLEVLQGAAYSSDFFQKAAQAVVDVVGLDRGRVLLYDSGEWKQAAVWCVPDVVGVVEWRPSQNILSRVVSEKRTFWQAAEDLIDHTGSLAGVEIVVASPILSREGDVIGAIYGDCREDNLTAARPKVTQVEAIIVELLARGVAVGLARMEQEKAVLAARVQFEQFFTPELSRQLAAQPNLLDGRDCEVTLLFCDIRAFSRISEKLGPEGTMRWIGAVMGALSDCVLKHKGVLVDYIGDELLAMWGAPEEHPDHARMACSAALDMLASLPAINERWLPILNEEIQLGIGINTGMARVGNTGSRHKFKYGPLGNAVNLASRVQGATKYLKCPLLVTEFSRARLGEGFRARKLCQARVVNIKQPVSLFELVPPDHPHWPDLQTKYEGALEEFDAGRFRPAARILGNLLGEVADDGPSLVLMSRAVKALVEGPDEQHPVWDLPGK